MSKYVRTKDGVYEISDENFESYKEAVYYYDDYANYILKCEIISQADTIEELCDKFVYVDTKHDIKEYKYMIRKSLSENDLKYIKMGTEIYGAIWTDKGLIYVAKMNEKGELELI